MRTILLCACVFTVTASGGVRLPSIISDHMVLQAGTSVPIWGWAEPGEPVTVTFAGQTVSTPTGSDGRWQVRLDPMEAANEPQQLLVEGWARIAVEDVLVGEVWLCSGQSNMEMQMKGLHGEVDNADAEIAAANHPRLRMFAFDEVYSIYKLLEPPDAQLADRLGAWVVCSPQTAATFIALGYYFGRDLQRELGTPVGLVNSSIGGTPIEAWTSLEAQLDVPGIAPILTDWRKRLTGYDAARLQKEYWDARARWEVAREAAEKADEPGPKAPAVFKNLLVSKPGGLFNGMIAPLIPYAVRGVLWYQGERNAAGAFTQCYGVQLETMVHDWRARWGEELYFAWVQLPRYLKAQQVPVEPAGWGTFVRDGMREALRLPRTAMAVTIDYGGERQGHPTNKADFARRLLLLPLHDVYGRGSGLKSGPLLRTWRRKGARMVLEFDFATGLRPAYGDTLKGFAIAGTDRSFVRADARIEGETVVVWSDAVAQPASVRYGWASNPVCNLVNAADLPASPFRTDDWLEAPQ